MEDEWLGAAIPAHIPDPKAEKPDDWNEEDDGEWEVCVCVCMVKGGR